MNYPRHKEDPPHHAVNDYVKETIAILTVVYKDEKEAFRDYLVFEISDSYGVVLQALTATFDLHETKSKMYLRFDGDKEKKAKPCLLASRGRPKEAWSQSKQLLRAAYRHQTRIP